MLRIAYAQARAASQRVDHVGPFVLKTVNVGQTPQGVLPPDQLARLAGFGNEICQPLLTTSPLQHGQAAIR